MKAEICPLAVVIGRVVIYTRNRFLAREIECQIEQDGLPSRMSHGTITLDGKHVRWVALPQRPDHRP
jgi:hypothetical protein